MDRSEKRLTKQAGEGPPIVQKAYVTRRYYAGFHGDRRSTPFDASGIGLG